jgi:hypothetical protein
LPSKRARERHRILLRFKNYSSRADSVCSLLFEMPAVMGRDSLPGLAPVELSRTESCDDSTMVFKAADPKLLDGLKRETRSSSRRSESTASRQHGAAPYARQYLVD